MEAEGEEQVPQRVSLLDSPAEDLPTEQDEAVRAAQVAVSRQAGCNADFSQEAGHADLLKASSRSTVVGSPDPDCAGCS